MLKKLEFRKNFKKQRKIRKSEKNRNVGKPSEKISKIGIFPAISEDLANLVWVWGMCISKGDLTSPVVNDRISKFLDM